MTDFFFISDGWKGSNVTFLLLRYLIASSVIFHMQASLPEHVGMIKQLYVPELKVTMI